MTLGDMLLENRIVFLEGVINDAVANLAVMKFLFSAVRESHPRDQFLHKQPRR